MRVLLLIDSLNSGGAQRQLAMLANYLHVNQRCEVEIVTYFPGNHYPDITTEAGVRVTYHPKKSKFDFLLLVKLVRFINKRKIDVVCSFLFAPSLYNLLLKRLSFRKVKVVVSERTFERKLDLISGMARRLYKYADCITANSQSQVNVLKSKFPSLKHKIVCIKNGVDIDRFSPNSNIEYGRMTVTAIGRIEEMKNPLCLIEAMHILKTKYGIVLSVKWAGSLFNSTETSLYYSLCNTKLEDYGLKSNWSWMGVVKNIPELISSTEMLIHPSLGEGFPNTICEAMSNGSIVFASSILDHPLIINEGENGFLFDPHNPEELAFKVQLYLTLQDSEKRRIRHNARETAIREFSYSKMAESYLALFQQHST